jgi:hypothetical protein
MRQGRIEVKANDRNAAVLISVGAVFFAVVVTVTSIAHATRNSSGTNSRVSGTPYVAGTQINTTTVNNEFSDISTELSDSLSRSGKGGMLAPLKLTDGTAANPSLSYTSDPDTGLYRIGANNVGMSAGSSLVAQWNATGFGVGGTPARLFHVQSGSSGATSSAASSGVFEGSASHFVSLMAPNAAHEGFLFGDPAGSSRGYIQYNNSADTGPDAMAFGTGGTTRLTLNSSGVTIGSGGTPISKSLRNTTTWDPVSLAAGNFDSTTISVPGAAAGADCTVTPPSLIATPYAVVPLCYVTADTCNVLLFSAVGTNNLPSGTWACRVFNP